MADFIGVNEDSDDDTEDDIDSNRPPTRRLKTSEEVNKDSDFGVDGADDSGSGGENGGGSGGENGGGGGSGGKNGGGSGIGSENGSGNNSGDYKDGGKEEDNEGAGNEEKVMRKVETKMRVRTKRAKCVASRFVTSFLPVMILHNMGLSGDGCLLILMSKRKTL